VVDIKSPLRELALFAGAGGGILGGKLLGWQTVCAVEWEPYAACVLAARQNDGLLPPFPIWDDIQTFDGRPWRGIVDVVSGGFPCQDISAAGKGAGIDGERSGMWREMARVIREVRPRFVFVENSPMLTSRGLGTVLGDLAELGFDARWGVLGAADVGAPHQRDRIWIVAHSREIGRSGQEAKQGMEGGFRSSIGCVDEKWWRREPEQTSREIEPGMGGLVDGVASRMDELAALGNGQVPLCAATAWRELSELL
jgi:DNA (cytosine-5)-methyltransferase 1